MSGSGEPSNRALRSGWTSSASASSRARCALSIVAVLIGGHAFFASAASAQPPTSGLVIEGQVTARSVRVRVDCGRAVGSVWCEVEQRFELEAERDDGRFYASDLRGLEVRLDGAESYAASLPRGRRIQVEVRYRVGGEDGWPVLVPPLSLRHPVFGESWRFFRARDAVRLPMPRGDGIRLDGEVVYEAHGVGGLVVAVGRERIMAWPHRRATWSDVEVELRHQPEPIANGGPVVTIGGQLRSDAPGVEPLLGVGYEIGLVEHLVLSLIFETTFESITEALLLELASPGLFILPSVSAGAGLVATQLGPRGTDAGLRVRLSLSTWVLGFIADFDYYVGADAWNIGLAARLGI